MAKVNWETPLTLNREGLFTTETRPVKCAHCKQSLVITIELKLLYQPLDFYLCTNCARKIDESIRVYKLGIMIRNIQQ